MTGYLDESDLHHRTDSHTCLLAYQPKFNLKVKLIFLSTTLTMKANLSSTISQNKYPRDVFSKQRK